MTDKLSLEIIDYCANRVGREMPIAWLQDHVVGRFKVRGERILPSSVDRILRQLRHEGIIDYQVTNRRQSLYRIDRVDRSVCA